MVGDTFGKPRRQGESRETAAFSKLVLQPQMLRQPLNQNQTESSALSKLDLGVAGVGARNERNPGVSFAALSPTPATQSHFLDLTKHWCDEHDCPGTRHAVRSGSAKKKPALALPTRIRSFALEATAYSAPAAAGAGAGR